MWGRAYRRCAGAVVAAVLAWGGLVGAETYEPVGTARVGRFPLGVEVDGRRERAYVADFGDDTVTVVDVLGASVVAKIPVGDGPWYPKMAPGGRWLCVPNVFARTLSVVDLETLQVAAEIPTGAYPKSVAFSADGATVVALVVTAGWDHYLSVVDLATQTVTRTIALPPLYLSNGFQVSAAGDYAYLTSGFGNAVLVIDLAAGSVVGTIPVGRFPVDAALSADGAMLAVANASNGPTGSVSIIDTATQTVSATISVTARPAMLRFNPRAPQLYVVDAYQSALLIVDLTTMEVAATIPVPGVSAGLPRNDVVVHPSGGHVVISSSGANEVILIDTSPGSPTYLTVVERYAFEGRPTDMAFMPARDLLVVVEYETRNLRILARRSLIATVESSVESIAMLLEQVPDSKEVAKALSEIGIAYDRLRGHQDGNASDGALHALYAGDVSEGLVKIRTAVGHLLRAEGAIPETHLLVVSLTEACRAETIAFLDWAASELGGADPTLLSDARARFAAGETLLQEGKFEAALREFRAAVDEALLVVT